MYGAVLYGQYEGFSIAGIPGSSSGFLSVAAGSVGAAMSESAQDGYAARPAGASSGFAVSRYGSSGAAERSR